MYAPTTILAVPTLALWSITLRRTRRKPSQCPKCGYDRQGLPTTQPCPECGTIPNSLPN